VPLDPSVRKFLDLLAAGQPGATAVPDVATRRANFRNLLRLATGPAPQAVDTHDDRVAGPGGPIKLRAYTPASAAAANGPALMFMHGGGFIAGDLETHDGVCRTLADASGCRVIAVDYRLAPAHRFPAAIDDGLAVLTALMADPEKWRIDLPRLAIGGDSVGANLAAVICQQWRDSGRAPLAAQLLICPALDLAGEFPSRQLFANGYYLDAKMLADDLANYRPDGISLEDPRLSPLRNANLSGLPPALIHAAEYDPFRDEAIAYGEALNKAGVVATVTLHPGMIHLFYALPKFVPQGGIALAAIGKQLGERLSKRG
jgi:acetyl esterase